MPPHAPIRSAIKVAVPDPPETIEANPIHGAAGAAAAGYAGALVAGVHTYGWATARRARRVRRPLAGRRLGRRLLPPPGLRRRRAGHDRDRAARCRRSRRRRVAAHGGRR